MDSNRSEYCFNFGTRKSALAVSQTNIVIENIKTIHKDFNHSTVLINTTGDVVRDKPIAQIGVVGVFSAELSRALLSKQVDIIVHSLKDLPTTPLANIVITYISKREVPYDVALFAHGYTSLNQLPPDSVVGTSSPRRVAQLKLLYPHLIAENIRGNVSTRIDKLMNDKKYVAIILAKAGLIRMNFTNLFTECLEGQFLYAVGQGAIATQSCESDEKAIDLLSPLTHVPTALCCICEREVLATLQGGCCVPVGVCSSIVNNILNIKCGVFSLDGKQSVIRSACVQLPDFTETNLKPYVFVSSVVISCSCKDAAIVCQETGRTLAQEIIASGGADIMKSVPHICLDRPVERVVSYDPV